MAEKMKAAVFVEPNRIVLDDKPIPEVGPTDALLRITTTTVCGTDVLAPLQQKGDDDEAAQDGEHCNQIEP